MSESIAFRKITKEKIEKGGIITFGDGKPLKITSINSVTHHPFGIMVIGLCKQIEGGDPHE